MFTKHLSVLGYCLLTLLALDNAEVVGTVPRICHICVFCLNTFVTSFEHFSQSSIRHFVSTSYIPKRFGESDHLYSHQSSRCGH